MSKTEKISTVVAFERWRSNRNGRQVPTPEKLRERAISLLKNNGTSEITSALRIRGGQLKQWRNALKSPEQTPQFVHLPLSLSSPTQTPVKVELRFGKYECKSCLICLSVTCGYSERAFKLSI